jgi:ABC-type sugar transport system permease subunit
VLTNLGWVARWFPVVKNPGLLQDPGTALTAVAASSIWANLGFTFVLVTAGLQSIPRDLYESAFVDGAGGWTRFTNVTLPMLSPTLLFSSVVLTSRAFQEYGEFDLLTSGGPNRATTTITYLAYGQGNGAGLGNDDGLKSTVAILLFVILLVLSALQFRGFAKRVQYGN